jgi:hypothetical protein
MNIFYNTLYNQKVPEDQFRRVKVPSTAPLLKGLGVL